MSMTRDDNTIAGNLARVHAAMADAAARAARPVEEIRLVAISKKQPVTAVAAAVAAGQRVFGENTVQEALPKVAAFTGQELEWHFIGHLQSNKARHIPGHFSWLHSLDSVKLAERVSRQATESDTSVNALIEVNVTDLPARQGVAPQAVESLLETLLNQPLPGLHLRGLMTMAPYPATPDEVRRDFARVRSLQERCRAQFHLPEFDQLSMGMSGDFVEAILEGSTLVRIGTAIFGKRDHLRLP